MNRQKDVFVDEPSTSSSHRFPRSRSLESSKIPEEMDGYSSDGNSNLTNIDGPAIAGNQTKTKGYRRIEEWHEETRDPKEVIRQLKQEKTRWKKTFDEFPK